MRCSLGLGAQPAMEASAHCTRHSFEERLGDDARGCTSLGESASDGSRWGLALLGRAIARTESLPCAPRTNQDASCELGFEGHQATKILFVVALFRPVLLVDRQN